MRLGQSNRVDDFASWLGCSPKTLHTSCMAIRGLGPKAMIEQRLVLEAQRRLAHTALPVEWIGAELGFSEPANFARLFKRVAGTSPGRFRTAHSGFVMRDPTVAMSSGCMATSVGRQLLAGIAGSRPIANRPLSLTNVQATLCGVPQFIARRGGAHRPSSTSSNDETSVRAISLFRTRPPWP